MKKPIAAAVLLLTAVILLSLCSCGKNSAASDGSMAGLYYLTDAEGEGSAALLRIRDGVTLEMTGDSAGTLALMGEQTEIRFDPETMTCRPDGRKPANYTFDDGRIEIVSETFTMVFEKQ